MRISDWSSDVCSSDLIFTARHRRPLCSMMLPGRIALPLIFMKGSSGKGGGREEGGAKARGSYQLAPGPATPVRPFRRGLPEGPEGRSRGRRRRSEEHTSELQSLMRISYAVFCLKKKKQKKKQ